MESFVIYEIIGYAASVLVAVSLMMSKIVRLRIVNLIGSATFSVYGLLIGSIPVAAMNAFIVCVNVYYLHRFFSGREYFKLLRVSPDSGYLRYFLDFYKDEILKYQPAFSQRWNPDTIFIFILRDMIPAGLLIGDLRDDGVFRIHLDFVIPRFRDSKVGHYLYSEQKSYLKNQGIREIRSPAGSQHHTKYLRRMGFVPDGSDLVLRYDHHANNK
jgi:hypothetical protein